MSESIEHILRELLLASAAFNTDDVLVNCRVGSKKIMPFSDHIVPVSQVPKGMLKEAKLSARESGVYPMCIADAIIKLKINGKEVETPVFLTPVAFEEDKVRELINFLPDDDQRFNNPFLARFLMQSFDINIEEIVGDQVIEKLSQAGLELIPEARFLGNFHHHRFAIIKELETIVSSANFSDSLRSLFGFSNEKETPEFMLPNAKLFAADVDHEQVFKTAQNSNLVIQGPPGTGKSQVISNLVGKLLSADKNMVVISEKHVALEIIKNKLATLGLDHFCYVASSNHLNTAFIRSLQECWQFIEEQTVNPVNNIMLSEQLEDHLQMTLDLLNVNDLIGGISFTRFMELYRNADIKEGHYSSDVPEMQQYLEQSELIQEIYQKGLSKTLGRMRSSLLKDYDAEKLDQKIMNWLEMLKQLQNVFGCGTRAELIAAMKRAAQCQVFENDVYKKYASIFIPDSPAQRKFLRLHKKYLRYSFQKDHFVSSSHWKIQPSLLELNALEKQLSGSGFLKSLRARRRWKNISFLPTENAAAAIAEERLIQQQIKDLSQLKLDFCDLEIKHVEKEVPLIYQTIVQFTQEEWLELHRVPLQDREKLTAFHSELNQLYHALKNHFNFNDDENLADYFTALQSNLGLIMQDRVKLAVLDNTTLKTIGRNPNYGAFRQEVLYSHFIRFSERFPEFANFNMAALGTKTENVIGAHDQEAELFAAEILHSISVKFIHYHKLLTTPARKLSEEQKALKQRLRKGKSILVKEFGKTRSHLSLRQLFYSEAAEWIRLLKPVWLSNPAQLANNFPLEENVFDVAIFDEASQIPLQNALGAIQRSKRVIVAGDEQQMGPSSYFSSGSTEVTDLLHQASFYYPKVAMQHHYRSEHPDLIAFSNKHFYNNELKVYPSFERRHPPLVYHFKDNGRFINRTNTEEAIAVSAYIESIINSKETIGIVAFSEEQLNSIYQHLSEDVRTILEERQENNTAFFKSLENVQGDECDLLIISFGYGKDEKGEFNMRFGPMNTANGRKRLNVLSTRAVKRTDLFCSVKSADFKLSDNESVNLLRRWLNYFENYCENDKLEFPFGLKPEITGNTVCFKNIHEQLASSRELVTLHRALSTRGWNIKYA